MGSVVEAELLDRAGAVELVVVSGPEGQKSLLMKQVRKKA